MNMKNKHKKAGVKLISLAVALFMVVGLVTAQLPSILPISPVTMSVIFQQWLATYVEARFYDGDNSHYVALASPTTVAANITFTLPAADGTANQLLKTDGALALGWTSLAGTANQVTVTPGASSITLSLPQSIATASSPTFTGLTLSGLNTANGIVRTDGSGVLSTATDLPTATTIGTKYVYRADGTDVAVADGGTNQSSYTDGQLLIGNTTGNTLAKASLTGTTDQVVVTNGAGSITLSLPQSIATTSSPQFLSFTIPGLSETVTDKNKTRVIIEDAAANVLIWQDYYWTGAAWAVTNNYGYGHFALYSNTGAYSNGFGFDALCSNTGAYSNGFGQSVLYNNTGAGSNGFGVNALLYGQAADNIAIGDNAWATFLDNTAGNKTFDNTDVVPATERITVTGHGFGATNAYVNLKYTQGTAAITGLTNGTVYQVQIIDANTLYFRTVNITDAGSGTGHTLTPQYAYSNSICIGADTVPTASNETTLGNSSTTTARIRGKTTIGGEFSRKYTVTIDNTNGVDTYTAAEMMGGLILRGTDNAITAAVVDVTATAAAIVAAIPGCIVGSGFEFRVSNRDATHTVSVDGGVGVTMSPNDPSTVIPAGSTGTLLVVVTNATAASEAVTIHCLGIVGH